MDSQTVARDSRLLKMPLEVLFQISDHLTTRDYGILRLVCKHMEASLVGNFAREFFTKRQFMLTEFSLQGLVDISKSKFSRCLSHVIISPERPSLSRVPGRFMVAPSSLTASDSQAVEQNCFRSECADHLSLISTGQDVVMLAEAFGNLPSLETVEIRDFNSRSRNREGPDGEWTSFGARKFMRETGARASLEWPGRHFGSLTPDHLVYLSHVFSALLRSLGASSSRPKRLEVNLRHCGLADHAFNIPRYSESVIEPVLSSLRTLFLEPNSQLPAAYVDGDNALVPCYSFLLRKFLAKGQQLEHFRINFRGYNQDDAKDFLLWLSKTPALSTSSNRPAVSLLESPQPVEFPKLEKLDIGMVKVEPQMLLAVLRKFQKTLRAVSFHRLSLLQTDPTLAQTKVDLWSKFFDQLFRLRLNLTDMQISNVSQQGPLHVSPTVSVLFNDQHPTRAVRKWAGKDFAGACKDFKESLDITWPPEDNQQSSGNDGTDVDSGDAGSDEDSDDDSDDGN
ncbi:uncharacterized protein BCR38DRAFT_410668 [Pseudomassariella vexata]|uniref:F-box domain-containing protein n=1 Tax=Pseudomassariella vexata TaxID=1141098 RepID=A0A1Y2DSJ3_9PEZI|nr:uncharacterized protein BCR38DRAFT_410668 [Pseudomassariella vexata]ORY62228.1 hypothetical protein BCR38DRAFT_410668 [Pseudomassariella vexata]